MNYDQFKSNETSWDFLFALLHLEKV